MVVIEAGSRARLVVHAYGMRAGRVEGQRGRAHRLGRARSRSRPTAARASTSTASCVEAERLRFDGRAARLRGRGRLMRDAARRSRRAAARCAARARLEARLAHATGSPASPGAAALGWYAADSLRHRREGAFGYEIEHRPRGRLRGLPARRRGAHRRADHEGQRGRAADQRRPDLPRLPGDDRRRPSGRSTCRPTSTGAARSPARWPARSARRRSEGVRCNVILDALGAAKMERSLVREMERAGVRVILFRPPKPYAIRRIANRTHRRLLVADGRVGMTGGVGIAAEWTGDAEGPDHWRDTHVRVRGPVVRGLQGAFAENWLEGTGEVLAGDEYLPELEPVERRRADAGRPLERQGRRHQRRGALLPGDRLGARVDRAHRRLLRPPAGVHRRALLGGRARRRGAHPGPRARTSTRASSGSPGAPPTTSCSRRACGCTSTSRRCCTRRRCASTAPGRRSGRSTSTTARFSSTTRSRSASGTSASPASSREAFARDLERSDGDRAPAAGTAAGPLQRAAEAATTVLRREL